MKRLLFTLILISTLVLAACSGSASAQTAPSTAPASATSANADGSLTRSNAQGAVTVTVTPLNLDESADTLEFDIIMDTHSVDLSMDLATLSTLTTDTGVTIQAISWDAPRGGHHVSGKLIFPSMQDGKFILEGARKLTLTILNLDAPSRIFEWELR